MVGEQNTRGRGPNGRVVSLSDNQVKIEWDDSEARSAYADVAQIKTSRDEFMLLFGRLRAGRRDRDEHRIPLEERIILSPVTAKRFAVQLDNFIRYYETEFGLLQKKAIRQERLVPTPPMRPPAFRSAKGVEKADLLFRFLEDHRVKPAFERSWGFLTEKLLGNRFLLGFEKKSIGQNPDEKILDVCLRMDMPADFLVVLQENLPHADIVGFGFGEDGDSCIVKAYLEFGASFYRSAKGALPKDDPYLSHLGLKWHAEDSAKKALARYTCFPGCTNREMQDRLSDGFYGDTSNSPFEIVKGILDLASQKVDKDRFAYLDVMEENNPRSSYDINLYGANLQLKEIYSFLLDLCRYYRIPEAQLGDRYATKKTNILGHLAGGRDRDGRDFLTLYFGE